MSDLNEMSIPEKIDRMKEIPKRMAEIEEDRLRLSNLQSVEYDSIGVMSGNFENKTEDKMILYAQDGDDIETLKKEQERLVVEIQSDIDNFFIGTDERTIDKRRVLKFYYINGFNLKVIAKQIGRCYSITKEIFVEGKKELFGEISRKSLQKPAKARDNI